MERSNASAAVVCFAASALRTTVSMSCWDIGTSTELHKWENGNDRWRYQVRNADSSGQLISKGPQAIAHQTPTHCPASPTTANQPQTNTVAIASSPPTWPSPVVETEEVGEDARPAEVGKDVTEEKERLRLHVLSLSLASVDVQFAWSQAVQQGTTGKRGGDGISENGGTGREAIDTTR